MSENRIFKRIAAGYKATITCSGQRVPAVIENLSEKGVNLLTDKLTADVTFSPGQNLEIALETPTGEIVNLQCTIKWATTAPPHNVQYKIGAQVLNPPWSSSNFFL